VGHGPGDGLLEQLAIADRPGGAAMAPPLGRHHKRAPAQLMGGTGNGSIGAAGTAVEQQMDKPAAAAGQQLSGDSLMGPGKITAAAGCDHKGASRSWTWPR
jgi:hypothetical protein